MAPKIHTFAQKGKEKKLKKALKKGADVNALDADGKCALFYAIAKEHKKCVKVLMAYGANPHIVSGKDVAFNAPNLTITGKENKDGIMPIPVKELKLDKKCSPILTCAGMMLQCDASLGDSLVTVKYANYVHSRSMKKLQQTQYDLLENEARILKDLNHPNVIEFLGTCQPGDLSSFLVVFQAMPKDSLAATVYNTKQSLGADKICAMILQVTFALKYLHESSIVHNYISARSVYEVGKRVILGDFIYAQNCQEGGKEISSVSAQLPWMAPAQINGANPESSSDIYSLGALTWELLARQSPCHWTTVKDTDCDSLFVFPLQDDWNIALRNIISFCVQPFPDARPSHDTLIELLKRELHGDDARKKGRSKKDDEIDLEMEQGEALMLKELHPLDIGALKNILYMYNLTAKAAQKTLDTARKHRRKSWAKLTMVGRALEGIAFDKKIPDRRREVALTILRQYRLPARDSQMGPDSHVVDRETTSGKKDTKHAGKGSTGSRDEGGTMLRDKVREDVSNNSTAENPRDKRESTVRQKDIRRVSNSSTELDPGDKKETMFREKVRKHVKKSSTEVGPRLKTVVDTVTEREKTHASRGSTKGASHDNRETTSRDNNVRRPSKSSTELGLGDKREAMFREKVRKHVTKSSTEVGPRLKTVVDTVTEREKTHASRGSTKVDPRSNKEITSRENDMRRVSNSSTEVDPGDRKEAMFREKVRKHVAKSSTEVSPRLKTVVDTVTEREKTHASRGSTKVDPHSNKEITSRENDMRRVSNSSTEVDPGDRKEAMFREKVRKHVAKSSTEVSPRLKTVVDTVTEREKTHASRGSTKVDPRSNKEITSRENDMRRVSNSSTEVDPGDRKEAMFREKVRKHVAKSSTEVSPRLKTVVDTVTEKEKKHASRGSTKFDSHSKRESTSSENDRKHQAENFSQSSTDGSESSIEVDSHHKKRARFKEDVKHISQSSTDLPSRDIEETRFRDHNKRRASKSSTDLVPGFVNGKSLRDTVKKHVMKELDQRYVPGSKFRETVKEKVHREAQLARENRSKE